MRKKINNLHRAYAPLFCREDPYCNHVNIRLYGSG
jgi:hypothetical protein